MYQPTTAEAREHLRRWAKNRKDLRQAAGRELPGDWIPIAVEVALEELDRLEQLNEGMVVVSLEYVP
jgi:hypothetical protein